MHIKCINWFCKCLQVYLHKADLSKFGKTLWGIVLSKTYILYLRLDNRNHPLLQVI